MYSDQMIISTSFQLDVYKLVAVVMHLGELKFKKRSSKDDQVVIAISISR